MADKESYNVYIVPSEKNPSFEQRESGMLHTSYAEELAFYALIEKGEVEAAQEMADKYMSQGVYIGKLSENPIRQMQYWSVCCITLGIRHAIQGGLDESTAYNLSDEYIRTIDELDDPQEILAFARGIVVELARLVRDASHGECPKPVRLCLDYIDRHLNEKITLSELAELTALSADYLSRLFKKSTGQNVGDYVMTKRLETAKSMLRSDIDQKLIAYYLGFCSQTYFITRFKKEYGMTPHKYSKLYNGK